MNRIGRLGTGHTNEEVVRFDIAVNQGLFVYGLYTGDLCHQKVLVINHLS